MKIGKTIQNSKGQGMTEYILIIALIAIAVIGAIKFFGKKTQEGFNTAGNAVNNAVQYGNSQSKQDGGGN